MTFTCLDNEMAIVNISGIDSKIFLQGQLTNDINLTDTQNSIFAAHLNNKGRILATFIITKVGDDSYYLLTTRDLIDIIIPRLKMFVLRSKVNINVINDKHIIFCENDSLQDTNLIPQPNTIAINITPKANLLITNNTTVLSSNSDDNIVKAWKLFLINNKIPLVYKATTAEFIPQHINYDTLLGVSFTKGCYTGQEIVARTHYLGKAKRHMYQFTCPTHVIIGQVVVSPKMNNQIIGIIVETIHQDTMSFGLTSLQCDCIDSAFIENMQLIIIQ